MRFAVAFAGLLSFALGVSAQQYEGDIISAYLPTVPGAEVAFFNIPDPTGAGQKFTLINYYSHGSNGGRIVESNIKRVVIALHGLLRDPNNYMTDVLNALSKVEDPNINVDSVAVIAPYFPNGNDKNYGYPWTDGLKAGRGSETSALVWSGSQWSAGANNQYPRASRTVSSFAVLDELIRYFDDAARFPNLNQIVLVGHSLGGQMLQRYAALGPDLQTRVPVTYWIGNPNSYTWMSEDRPLSTAACPTFDEYRAGFSNYTNYPMTYGAELVTSGREAIQANYASKQIAYARAMQDHGDHSDGDCASSTTGGSRHERFFFFIQAWVPTCEDPASRNCDTVDLVDALHDNGQMFSSPAGLARLFTDNFYGDGARAYDFGNPRAQAGDDPFPDPMLVNVPNSRTNYNVYAGGMTYQGCWTNQAPTTPAALETLLYDNAGNSIEGCVNGCLGAGYSIAGLQNGSQCFCGNALNAESAKLVVDTACRSVCPGNAGQICGAWDRLSVFSKGFPAFV